MIDGLVSKLVSRGTLTLVFPDGKERRFGPGGAPDHRVHLADRKVAFDLMRNPRLALGEAYMDGRLVIEQGNILGLLEQIVGSNRWEDGGQGRKLLQKGKIGGIRKLFRRNDARASKRNVAHHYDLGDDLYRLFLDEQWQYSCAYFTDPGNNLDEAQADKLAHIAAKLDLKPGQKVLDIGSGWGGLALYLNRVAGVEVLGITLSEHQLAEATRRAKAAGVADKVTFRLIDYRALEGQFDRVVSIGMFEHVGAAHYDEFFAACKGLLTEDGVMLLHTIGKLGGAGAPDPFTDKWIFPGYHLPSLSQMVGASEKVRLIASDVETLRLHYAYTLRHWLDRVTKAKAEVVKLYDERFFRMWEFYLAGGIVMFENGAACNYQVQYIRDRRALPITRDYIGEAEQRYRAMEARPAKAKRPRKAAA